MKSCADCWPTPCSITVLISIMPEYSWARSIYCVLTKGIIAPLPDPGSTGDMHGIDKCLYLVVIQHVEGLLQA